MKIYYGDFHIHIGRNNLDQIVKIPSAANLTLANIAKEALMSKGLDIIGVVDCASPLVLKDLHSLVDQCHMKEIPGGGLLYQERLLVLLAAEFELGGDRGGSAHFLAFMPTLKQMEEFSKRLGAAVTNINLSSQRAAGTPQQWFDIVAQMGGLLIPAHVFTPYKGLLGNMAESVTTVLTRKQIQSLAAIELGLSADTAMGDSIPEFTSVSFLSNSDAHSLPKIAREYNVLMMKELSFTEWKKALFRQDGRGVIANYGLDPRLGKFHRSRCLGCGAQVDKYRPPMNCSRCGSDRILWGVLDRVRYIGTDLPTPAHRPPYYYQIPLEFVPGVGPKTLRRLIQRFGSEMAVLHRASEEELAEVVGAKLARSIQGARTGKLAIAHGGGGEYGKVLPDIAD